MRRTALVLVCLALAGCDPTQAVDAPASARADVVDQPNVLLVVTDDQRADDLAFMPLVMDRLGGGAAFSRAYATTSWCCPARTTIMRGQYAHNHGIKTNASPNGGFDVSRATGADQNTLPVWLQGAGYRTALFGKYLNGYDAPGYVPPGWDEWLATRGDSYTLTSVYHNGTTEAVAGEYSTDYLTARALAWVTAQTGPWFVYLAYKAPHDPATPAPRHVGAFAGLADHRPPSFNLPLPWESLRHQPLDAAQVAAMDANRRARLETLLAVDEGVAALVDSLAALGQLERTLVVFTSDNGYLVGEHALQKKNLPYEESIRVPLLVRGPGVVGRELQQLVGLVDLAPTVADYAGAAAPAFVDGRSLRPLLEGAAPAWRTALLTEHWRESTNVFGVRTARWWYAGWKTGGSTAHEVYDMAADPYQLDNLKAVGDPTFNWLRDLTTALKTCASATCRALEDQPLPAGF